MLLGPLESINGRHAIEHDLSVFVYIAYPAGHSVFFKLSELSPCALLCI